MHPLVLTSIGMVRNRFNNRRTTATYIILLVLLYKVLRIKPIGKLVDYDFYVQQVFVV